MSALIELLQALLLGFIEGMTEFAPISSTGHMIIFDDLWLQTKVFLGASSANTFKVCIQLGSILAVVIVMRERIVDLFKIGAATGKQKQKFNLLHIFVGILPAGLAGFLLESYIDAHLFTIKTVILGLLYGAILMIIADKSRKKVPAITSLDALTYWKAFQIGLIQCFSLWPGFSRSGATISGGVLFGLSYRTAADFTFIMAIPIMAGASGLSLLKHWHDIHLDDLWFYIVGFVSAFFFALLSIKFFLKLISKIKLMPFAIYRILLAIVLIVIVYF